MIEKLYTYWLGLLEAKYGLKDIVDSYAHHLA
jgi:hypothetical protein